MSHFRRIVAAALLAGLVAGLWLSAARQLWVVPLILQAEELEQVTTPHGHPLDVSAHPEVPPAVLFARHAWTWVANVLTFLGFAFLVAAGMELSGRGGSILGGLGWGLAGFAVFSLAPGLALPPVLPGVPEAPLAARQLWWLVSVSCTAAGLSLLAFGPGWRRALVLILLPIPYLVGAPQPSAPSPAALADLSQRFAILTLAVNLSAWLVLGAVSGWGWRRLAKRGQRTRARHSPVQHAE